MVSSHANFHHVLTHINDYVDNMVPCEEDGCSYYYWKMDDKYRYCETCRKKDIC